PLNTSGPLEAGGKPQQHVRLMRFDPATRKSETVGVPRPVGLELEKIKHTFPRQDIFRVYYMQGAAVGPDGSLYLLGIYPQLHVVCFPKLTAPRRQKEKRHQALEIRSWQYPGFGDYWLLGPELVADKPGGVRLTHSVLLADETGATDFRQGEALGERVHAKKVFRLDSPDLTEAELLFYGSAKEVRANGTPLKKVGPLVSTGWSRVRVPVALLKQGANEFVFSGGGSLLLEPGRAPGHSFKSDDGGRTWSDRALGAKGDQQGEYLVRLRLGRYAPHGRATSRVLDLWAEAPGEIAAPGEVVAFRSPTSLNEGQPRGTRVVAWLRTGSTPVPDAEHWSAWRALDKELTPDAKGAGHRWAQLALELRTARPQASPALSTFHFDYVWRKGDPSPDREKFRVRRQPEETNPVRGLSPVPFVYQGPSPRLKLLRERYQLDKVIAPGRTEMERLMLLRYWVRNQWHTAWGSHPAAWMPPWDALVILESKDQPDCLTMCTHYACVFTQCCLALGWNARHCILDHHCVAEVWVDQHGKWVMMDAGNSARRADVGLHFERDGVPLSARELHLAYRDGKSDGLRVCFTPAKLAEQIAPLCRPAPQGKPAPRPDTIPLADLKGYPVCQLNNYRRYAFPARNDYLTSPLPGELYQGWSEYFYDGYWWVGDSPEYSRHLSPARPQDIDWDVNWCRLHLSHTDKPGELRVDVEAHVPNLARLERTAGDKEAWQATPAGFVWKLKPGENVLLVRGVNAWGRAGRAAAVAVEWKSAN
ncbi:MAG TPA: transglutaminase-like domain-containing protein, partial [Gemmataceae bacterium]|nr:transglutaminase-like domain-containing protein [Gemmataceae bacterium]